LLYLVEALRRIITYVVSHVILHTYTTTYIQVSMNYASSVSRVAQMVLSSAY